jgi:hypothetical protein
LDKAEAELAERLVMEWLEHAVEQASHPQEQAAAVRELAYIRRETCVEGSSFSEGCCDGSLTTT